jgi:hypothetical protein
MEAEEDSKEVADEEHHDDGHEDLGQVVLLRDQFHPLLFQKAGQFQSK